MTGARATAGPDSEELIFRPERTGGTLAAAIGFFAVAALCVWLVRGLASAEQVAIFVLALVMMAVTALVILATLRGLPRLHLWRNYAWIQTLLGPRQMLDLDELGEAQMVEYRRNLHRSYYLGFLRRDEEQVLREAGQPVPKNIAAFYRSLAVGILVSDNPVRVQEIAGVINARRNRFAVDLETSGRAAALHRIEARFLFYALTLVAVFVVSIVVLVVLRNAT